MLERSASSTEGCGHPRRSARAWCLPARSPRRVTRPSAISPGLRPSMSSSLPVALSMLLSSRCSLPAPSSSKPCPDQPRLPERPRRARAGHAGFRASVCRPFRALRRRAIARQTADRGPFCMRGSFAVTDVCGEGLQTDEALFTAASLPGKIRFVPLVLWGSGARG